MNQGHEKTRIFDEMRFYLQENLRLPVVHEDDGKQHRVGNEENHGHLLWIGYKDHDIIVDFFHGISDGRGILKFINTLLYYYCQEKYNSINAEEIPVRLLYLHYL